MRSRRLETACLGLCLLVSACSDRAHDNPFDPANPDTQGRPVVLTAIPGDMFVSLYWDIPERDDIVDGELLRSFGGTAPTAVLDGLSGSGSTRDYLYPDSPLERSYWLEVTVRDWSQSHRSDTASVILSSGICWVGSGYDEVFLVSPTTSLPFPGMQLGSFLVDLSPDGNGVWAAGAPGGMIYRVEQSADSILLGEALSTSLDVSSISTAHNGMLLIAHLSGLTWYDPQSYRLDPWVDDPSLEPVMVRLAPETSAAWVYTADSRVVRFSHPSSVPTNDWDITGVSALSPASDTVCWLLAQNDLYRVDNAVPAIARVVENVSALAARNSRECWVARAYEGSVELLSADGATISSRTMSAPILLAYSAADSVLWVADTDRKISKLLPDLRAAMNTALPADPWSLAAP